jgi:hypothetical protein
MNCVSVVYTTESIRLANLKYIPHCSSCLGAGYVRSHQSQFSYAPDDSWPCHRQATGIILGIDMQTTKTES